MLELALCNSKPNITEEFIEKNIDKKWDWHLLSKDEKISLNL